MTPTLRLRARVGGTASAEVRGLGGRRVVLVRIDPAHRRGALDEVSGELLAHAARSALAARLPLVGVIATSGADVHDGVAALHGWGGAASAIAACSGVVPVLLAVTGATVSGPALLLGMADVVVLTHDAAAYVVGPRAAEAFTGERLTAQDLGGAGVHHRSTGVAAAVVPDEDAALSFLAATLAHLPSSCDDEAPRWPTDDPSDRRSTEAGGILPASAAGSYDVRDVVRGLVDDGELLELWAAWAPNLVTGFATLGGHSVGLVANQPLSLAGTIDIPASQKGARFVAFCDAFNLPVVTFVDTPGFFPGKDLEWRGMIRHGAQLVGAYARATVPRICVVLRKAYGGAYIVMDSKTMGNDLCVAWPTAELAVMGAKGAVEILHRRADEVTRARAEADYAETLLTPWVAAERGYVDAVVEPSDTREVLTAALDMLRSKRELLRPRSHDNLPL
jgi:acetyl-CoA carboxylase carboxyltransferase component